MPRAFRRRVVRVWVMRVRHPAKAGLSDHSEMPGTALLSIKLTKLRKLSKKQAPAETKIVR